MFPVPQEAMELNLNSGNKMKKKTKATDWAVMYGMINGVVHIKCAFTSLT